MVEYLCKNQTMPILILLEVSSWKTSCTNLSIHWKSYASIIFVIIGAWTVHQKEGMVQERGDESRTHYVYKVLDPERCGTHTVPQNKHIHVFYLCSYEKKSSATRD